MSLKPIFTLLVVIVVAVLANSTTKCAAEEDLVQSWCNKTHYVPLCLSLINNDPRQQLKSDPRNFLRILIENTISNVTTTAKYISDLRQNVTDNLTSQYYDECSDEYGSCVVYLNSALNLSYFEDKSTSFTLDIMIGGCVTGVSNCEDIFNQSVEGNVPIKSPFTNANNYVRDVCSLSVETVNLIACNDTEPCFFS